LRAAASDVVAGHTLELQVRRVGAKLTWIHDRGLRAQHATVLTREPEQREHAAIAAAGRRADQEGVGLRLHQHPGPARGPGQLHTAQRAATQGHQTGFRRERAAQQRCERFEPPACGRVAHAPGHERGARVRGGCRLLPRRGGGQQSHFAVADLGQAEVPVALGELLADFALTRNRRTRVALDGLHAKTAARLAVGHPHFALVHAQPVFADRPHA
jgi:hypothetical protein